MSKGYKPKNRSQLSRNKVPEGLAPEKIIKNSPQFDAIKNYHDNGALVLKKNSIAFIEITHDTSMAREAITSLLSG